MNNGPPLNDFLHQSFDMDEFLSAEGQDLIFPVHLLHPVHLYSYQHGV